MLKSFEEMCIKFFAFTDICKCWKVADFFVCVEYKDHLSYEVNTMIADEVAMFWEP